MGGLGKGDDGLYTSYHPSNKRSHRDTLMLNTAVAPFCFWGLFVYFNQSAKVAVWLTACGDIVNAVFTRLFAAR